MQILVISASGMGCTIMATPALRILRDNFKDAEITFLTINEFFAEPIRRSRFVDHVEVFKFKRDKGFFYKGFFNRLSKIKSLHGKKYDVSITFFPSNKWYFNVFAFLIGAKKRITHRYKHGQLRTLSFLQNIKVDADPKLHDVEQNVNLLKAMNIGLPKETPSMIFATAKEDDEKADEFWDVQKLNGRQVIGIHPGSSKDYKFIVKRWPSSNFSNLVDLLNKKNYKIILFQGPDDAGCVKSIISKTKDKPIICREKLSHAASIISKCDYFISNDSGLMHVAVAKGVPTIGILGPTNHVRTSPYGEENCVVRQGVDCSPCLNYPFKSTSAKLKCTRKFCCLKSILPEDILMALEKLKKKAKL